MTSLDELSVDAARILVQATTVDIFNEQDLSKRRQLMEKHWAADLTCYSVMGAYTGYDALDRLWDGLHADEKATWVFQRSGEFFLNFDLIMQSWVYGPVGEEPGMKGWDVIQVNNDGKVQKLYALINGVGMHDLTV